MQRRRRRPGVACVFASPRCSSHRGDRGRRDRHARGRARPAKRLAVAGRRPGRAPVRRVRRRRTGPDIAASTSPSPPGTPVRAAGAGTVTFAGDVAGALHVVVTHRNGLRTSYSFLADITVAVGDAVTTSTVVGHSGGADPDSGHGPDALHFGLRIGDRYVDPLLLFQTRDLTELVRLVPSRRSVPTGRGSTPTSTSRRALELGVGHRARAAGSRTTTAVPAACPSSAASRTRCATASTGPPGQPRTRCASASTLLRDAGRKVPPSRTGSGPAARAARHGAGRPTPRCVRDSSTRHPGACCATSSRSGSA